MKLKVLTNEFVTGIEKVAQGRVKGKTQLPILKEILFIVACRQLLNNIKTAI
jgi:DNA polymerase III sliding clamp (beta) subunit (PCNA family)